MFDLGDAELELVPLVARHETELPKRAVQRRAGAFAAAAAAAGPSRVGTGATSSGAGSSAASSSASSRTASMPLLLSVSPLRRTYSGSRSLRIASRGAAMKIDE